MVSHDTVWRFLPRGQSFKKRSSRLNGNAPMLSDGASAGSARGRHLDPARLVFIDETWIKTNMVPIRGWGQMASACWVSHQMDVGAGLTFLAALRVHALTEPCVVDGPINGTIFRGYVEQFPVPTLIPGDIVILDNFGSHRSRAIRTALLDVGAKLAFLPPYSPDLNPPRSRSGSGRAES